MVPPPPGRACLRRTQGRARLASSRPSVDAVVRGPQVLVDERDRHAALAYCSRDALDGAEADVAAGEDAGHAGLEEVRVALELPAAGGAHVRAGQDVAVPV